QETPGYQTIEESTYDNWKASKDQVNCREHVDRGGAVDYGPSAVVRPIGFGKRSAEAPCVDTGTAAYVKFDRSFDKKEHLDSAFEGVDGLLVLGCCPTKDISDTAKMLFDAAREKGIGHVVCLSPQGASKKTGVLHMDSMCDMEEHLRNCGLSYTILRPALCMEYFLSDESLCSLREGCLEMPLSPDRPVDLVSAADVGHVVAEAFLVSKKLNGKEIDLVADRLSMIEIASALGRTFSKQVECRKADGPMNDYFRWMEENAIHGDIGRVSEFLNRFNIHLTTFRDYLLETKDTVSFEKFAKAA
ncbi:MAG: NmrA family NAD(P)-binding protein, partial [Thermodesulfobacteriota bacterium]